MNLLFPILAALLISGSLTLDKVVLSMRRVNYQTYTGVGYPIYFFILLTLFFIFKPPLSLDLFAGKFIFLLAFAFLVSLGTNLLYYRALDGDRLSEMQMIDLVHIFPVILFAGIVFADERNAAIFTLALIASIVVVWSHWNRHHFTMAKSTAVYFLWMITIAPLSALAMKELLTAWHPLALLLVIQGSAAFILLPLFFKYTKRIHIKSFFLLILTNILSAIAWILFYFSYQQSGIIYTVLIFSLQPLLVYFASVIFLKEHLSWKKFIAFFTILTAIIIAQVL